MAQTPLQDGATEENIPAPTERVSGSTTRPVVFVHTNAKQRLGARISAHSLKLTSARPETFDVRLLNIEDFPDLLAAKGRSFLRDGHERAWDPNDLQSFTPLRFAVPDVMGHEGRAVVIDPDVFAVGDVADLLDWDMGAHPLWCRERPGHNGSAGYLASSVMLLDCARLPDWDFAAQLDALWSGRLDYVAWIELGWVDRAEVGLLPPEWNDFDRLTPSTRMLHTTKRRTQPWKTGLPVDYTLRERGFGPIPASVVTPVVHWWTRNTARYRPHPDPNQERYIFALLADLLDTGGVTEAEIETEIARSNVRPDALRLVEQHRGAFWPAVVPPGAEDRQRASA
ncbi:MAG: hypothetical protein AAF371_14510 [Pseudomonadota bacterium]